MRTIDGRRKPGRCGRSPRRLGRLCSLQCFIWASSRAHWLVAREHWWWASSCTSIAPNGWRQRFSTFIIGTDCQLPEDLISFIRLLLQTDMEWEKTKKKSKLPKPSLDAEVFPVAIELLVKRLSEYPTTVQVRTNSVSTSSTPSKLIFRRTNHFSMSHRSWPRARGMLSSYGLVKSTSSKARWTNFTRAERHYVLQKRTKTRESRAIIQMQRPPQKRPDGDITIL